MKTSFDPAALIDMTLPVTATVTSSKKTSFSAHFSLNSAWNASSLWVLLNLCGYGFSFFSLMDWMNCFLFSVYWVGSSSTSLAGFLEAPAGYWEALACFSSSFALSFSSFSLSFSLVLISLYREYVKNWTRIIDNERIVFIMFNWRNHLLLGNPFILNLIKI